MPDPLPTRTIANLTTAMAKQDLPYLQHRVRQSLLFLPQEQVERAYSVAREMHPQAPSLKELMAWNRPSPLPEIKVPSPEMDDLADLLNPSGLPSE